MNDQISKKLKKDEYKKNIKKINNLPKKFVLIQIYTGFGNKIFDLIISIYLKKKFNYNIYFVDTKSSHSKSDDPDLKLIFKNLDNEIIFINDNEGDYLRYVLKIKNIPYNNVNNINDISKYFTHDRIRIVPTFLYKLVFDIWDSFSIEEKKIFTVNDDIIDKNIIIFTKIKYATIHIRYGDKLKLGIININEKKIITFPLYTPEYYYDQIKIILKLNLPIIILSDSKEIVTEFILKKYNLDLKNIFLLDINFINSFYFMMYSSYSVLSHSTFSYASYLLSKEFNKNRIIVFCTIPNIEKNYGTADLLISKEWKIISNPKYILNLNQKLLKEMLLFNEKYIYNYYKK